MSLANLTSSQLAQLVGLIKQKEQLQSQLERVDAELQALDSGAPLTKTRTGTPPFR